MESPKTHVFTTENLPEHLKLEYWTKELGRRLHAVEVSCQQQAEFYGGVESISMGPIAVTRYFGPAVTIARTETLLRNVPSLRFHLVLTQDGRHVLSQLGRTVDIASGDMVLIDSHLLSSSVKEQVTDARVISLSEAFVNHWIPRVELCVAHVLKGSGGWGAVLSTYLRNLDAEVLQAEVSLYEQALIADHIASLMLFAFKEAGLPKAENSRARNLRQRGELHRGMVLWLRQNYHNANVTAQTVADAFRMSVRNVHHVFLNAGDDTSFHSMLRDIRLDAAIRLLAEKDVQAMSLAEIGWRCGFAEQSHFCRVFRQQKKMSPGAYAEMLRAEGRAGIA
ncbi:AraC family transcriptional regulator [Collimonas humicola]|uniref:AraC family transcriptional regulator n=1 Tax=Collimonas humicola TaxID=2825886 RepID=UPI001B8C68A8|nr:AraC family transcriptional regulator [Collimonas humicola]